MMHIFKQKFKEIGVVFSWGRDSSLDEEWFAKFKIGSDSWLETVSEGIIYENSLDELEKSCFQILSIKTKEFKKIQKQHNRENK